MLALARGLGAALPGLPILWVSVAQPSRATRALPLRAHLVKPCSLAELTAAVAEALGGGPSGPAG